MIITKHDENDNGASAAATDGSGGNMKWEKSTRKLTILHFIKYCMDDQIDEENVNESCSTHDANDKNTKIRSNG